MAILNYTTTISANKTIGEITKLLLKHDASKISVDYVNAMPVNITFLCEFQEQKIFYSMPCRIEGILKLLAKQSRVPKTTEQALKIGWRIIKDWLESQLALVEAELAELPEIFLPYACTRNGDRLYDYIKNLDNINTPLLIS